MLPVELEIEGSSERAVSIPSRFEVVRVGKSEKNAFSCRIPRFKRPKNDLPGPGEYETLKSNPLVKNSKSISEKGFGQLCSRNPRFHGFSRSNFNPPGPGHYTLPTFIDRTLKKNKNRVHGNSGFVPPKTTSLHFYKTRSTPGPGQYNPSTYFRHTRGTGISTSSFRSGTRRPFDPEKKKKKKTENEVSPVMGRKTLNIGEKGSRFQSWEMSTVKGVHREERKRLIRRMKRKKKGIVYSDERLPQSVFRSKSKRGHHVGREKIPGPGTYEYDPKKKIKRGRKGGGRNRRIGLKTSQFDFPGSSPFDTEYVKPSSCFAAKGRLDRFGRSYLTKLRKKRPSPGPGSYYPNYFEEERKKRGLKSSVLHEKGSSMFSSRTSRFRGMKTQTEKGPACYDPLVRDKKQFHLNYQRVWM